MAGRYEGRASARERGYTHKWDKARATFLRSNPLCRKCMREGQITAATVVDHVKPHKGEQALFWDTDNWQPLCAPCHSSTKQREERGRVPQAVGEDGWPV